MKRWLEALVYFLLTLAAFYLLPLVIRDTGSGILVLLFGVPLIVFASALVCGIRCGFLWIYPVAAAALFVPSIYLYYNESAYVYAIAYGIIALIGIVGGGVIRKFVLGK